MSQKIAVLFADGFEEVEAVTPVDVLRRLEFDVKMVGVSDAPIGSHGMKLEMDSVIDDVSADEFDAVVLPGGLPGSTNLRDDDCVLDLVKSMSAAGKLVCAICAAPIVLAKAGVVEGKKCAGYPMPMVRRSLSEAGAEYTEERVAVDGNIVTGKGPGAAAEFALSIASALGKESQAKELAAMMFVGC